MKISGHRTAAVFRRYNITTEDRSRDSALKVEAFVTARDVPVQQVDVVVEATPVPRSFPAGIAD